MRALRIIVAAWLCPLATAQSVLVITVGVRTCPTTSSTLRLPTTLPTYSTVPFSGSGTPTILSSMQPPPTSSRASSTTATARTLPSSYGGPSAGPDLPPLQSTPTASQSSEPIPIPSYTSDENITSTEGNVYSYQRDMALSGTTIQSSSPGLRRRQGSDPYRSLYDCLQECDDTAACVAINLLGQNCQLYGSVLSATDVLGAQAAFNVQRFRGYGDAAASITPSSMSRSTPAVDTGNDQFTPPAYSTPYMSTPGGPPISASSTFGASSSASSGLPSTTLSSMERSASGVYSTPLISTDHATTFVPPPSPTSLLSTILPVTLSIPSSLLITPSSDISSSSIGNVASSLTGYPSSQQDSSETSSEVRSRSESPLVSATTPGSPPLPTSTSAYDTQVSSSEEAVSSSLVVTSTSEEVPTMETSVPEDVDTSTAIPSSVTSDVDDLRSISTTNEWTSSLEVLTSLEVAEDSSTVPFAPSPSSSAGAPSSISGGYDQATTTTTAMTSAMSSSTISSEPQGPSPYPETTPSSTLSSSAAVIPTSRSFTLATSSFSSRSSSSSPAALSLSNPGSTTSSRTSSFSIAQPTSSASPTSSMTVSSVAISPTSSSRSTTSLASSSMTSSSTSSAVASSPSSAQSNLVSTTTTSTRKSSSSRYSATSSSFSSSSSPVSSTSSTLLMQSITSSSSTPSVPSSTPVRNRGKRGLCYTNDTLTSGYSLSGQNSKVSWGYNYYYQNNTSPDSPGINPALTFVPLLFNDDANLMRVWPQYAQKAIDEGADSLLGFNEPDLCYPGSACMTVNQSVRAWRTAMEPFAGKARLGAPAVTNGGPPSSLQWLGEFMGNCTGCTIDFVPLHWYSSVYAFSYLQYYVQLAYNVTKKPIWVTEFGIDSSGGSEQQYQAFLQMALPWLDAVPYVERYSYFYNGPGYLINANGSGLSAQGMIYNSYTAPCPNWQNTQGHC